MNNSFEPTFFLVTQTKPSLTHTQTHNHTDVSKCQIKKIIIPWTIYLLYFTSKQISSKTYHSLLWISTRCYFLIKMLHFLEIIFHIPVSLAVGNTSKAFWSSPLSSAAREKPKRCKNSDRTENSRSSQRHKTWNIFKPDHAVVLTQLG